MREIDSRFVRQIPKIFVDDGHIFVDVGGILYAWTPHLFTAFVVECQRALADWHNGQRAPVPLPQRGKRR